MVLNKVTEIVSAAVARLSAPKTSNTPYPSLGLPPLPGSLNVSNLDQKNKLRLSSSLQDLSAYRRLDLEDGGPNPEIERDSTNLKRLNLFKRENLGTSFSKVKGTPTVTSARTKWTQVIFVLLCLLLVAFLLYVMFFHFNLFGRDSKYYVVLDCGSTGTRVYVYQASPNYVKDNDLPIVLRSLPESFQRNSRLQSGRAYNRMETEPGFDKLVHNTTGLKRAIKPLIKWAAKQIPRHAHKTTYLYLHATAGVRRLPNSDSEWLLNNAWSILKSSPFLCKREWVKTITGMEEAYFGWIAMNYHTGVLGAKPKKGTFGALDLGGSSLQVTFESKGSLPDETSLELNIGAVNHHLTAYSLEGYGLNDAFDKSVVQLVKRLPKISDADLTSGNIEIKHPCLNSGYKEQYICTHCFSLYQEGGNPSSGREVASKGGKPGVRVQLVGAPKWEECSSLAKFAVNISEWSNKSSGIDCELQPCALAENLPRPFGQFYAMSGFFVVYRFFNLTPDAALDDVLEKGREFCDKTWDVAKTSVAPQPFIEQYCFRAPYIVSLLREGLHITDSQVTIGSGSITWTLGVALSEAGKAVSTGAELISYKLLLMKMHPAVVFAILFASLAVLLCALSCVGKCMPRFFRRAYLPLFRNNNASSTSIINIPAPFNFKRWSPVITGEGRVKTPLSPTIANTQQRPFDTVHGFGGNGIQLAESSLYSSSSSVAHSFSSGSLGQMQYESSTTGSFWSPHRSQQRLQSRRSQSREDLISSLSTEVPLPKV